MIKFIDWGTIDYKEAWDNQELIFGKYLDTKKDKLPVSETPVGDMIFCEHPHVYTLGKSGDSNNMLINDAFLKQVNATYYKTNRGGDITYHGPGQIVGYPILDLESMNLSLKQYINKIEDVIISTLLSYGIDADRLEGATGVWLDKDNPAKARKICAIGVKASRYITMHGFALNVNTDLQYFNHINPCGFVDKGVTSVQKEVGKEIDIEETKARLKENFEKAFGTTFY
ncbi:MAG: lipoyl(octanoyl) transferase LipB [Bacteroidales bacterium]|jgi:lipoyl(octanoyl) transferase|nr:lipoyl(octanoyl) transferase LipB [Bacteroidales bacterium]